MVVFYLHETLGILETEGEPVTVVQSWRARYGRGTAGYARLRHADGRVSEARFDRELLPQIVPGHRTVAWVRPDEPPLMMVGEELGERRTVATIGRVLCSVIGLLLVAVGIAGLFETPRRRRLFRDGVAVAGEIVALHGYNLEYRYRDASGLEHRGHWPGTEKRWAEMGRKPEVGMTAWILYAPDKPKRHVLHSWG